MGIEGITAALKAAGYDSDPTEKNLIECFLDYVAAGVWWNLDYEEAKDDIEDGLITVKDMCGALLRYCR